MKRITFNRGMALLASTWPERAPTPDTLTAYWMALSDLHDTVFEAAIAACLTSCTFYPKPAEIRAKAEEALKRAGVLPNSAEAAWAELQAAKKDWHPDIGWIAVHPKYPHLGRVGGMPCPLPQLIQDALRTVGGPVRVFECKVDDIGFVRREFEAAYEDRRRSEVGSGSALLSQPLPAALPEPGEAA